MNDIFSKLNAPIPDAREFAKSKAAYDLKMCITCVNSKIGGWQSPCHNCESKNQYRPILLEKNETDKTTKRDM
jgi:hypothetical protein